MLKPVQLKKYETSFKCTHKLAGKWGKPPRAQKHRSTDQRRWASVERQLSWSREPIPSGPELCCQSVGFRAAATMSPGLLLQTKQSQTLLETCRNNLRFHEISGDLIGICVWDAPFPEWLFIKCLRAGPGDKTWSPCRCNYRAQCSSCNLETQRPDPLWKADPGKAHHLREMLGNCTHLSLA